MSRLPQRRAGAIQTDLQAENGTATSTEPSKPAEAGRIALGWRLAIVVWLCGFVGLFLFELWNLLWKVGKSMF